MGLLTVKNFSIKANVSDTTIYKYIKNGTLTTKTINGRTMLDEEQLETLFEVRAKLQQTISNGIGNPFETNQNNSSHNPDKIYEKDFLENLVSNGLAVIKNEDLEKLQTELNDLKQENKDLYERLISLEREQKQEIQKVHNAKDEQLKMYMELLKKQTDNILEAQPHQKHSYNKHKDDSHEVEIIEADTEPAKERMKPKKFFKLLGERGYSEKEIKSIIKQQLKSKDPRFAVIDGKMVIYKDKFNDL